MKLLNSLVLALALLVSLFACNEIGNAGSSGHVETISQELFKDMQTDSNTMVLDVRTPSEVAKGYIAGTQFFADYNGSNFEVELEGLDKNKTYLVYCRSGNRSSKACNMMLDKGFKKVFNLDGGISEWSEPLVTK